MSWQWFKFAFVLYIKNELSYYWEVIGYLDKIRGFKILGENAY